MSPNVVFSVRSLIAKYETRTRQSGDIGFSLRDIGDAGAELRASLQATELGMRVSKSTWDEVRLAVQSARESVDAVRTRLEALGEGVVFICEANGPSEARRVLDADNRDSAAIAQNLAPLVRHVSHVGAGLAKWLIDVGAEFTAAEATLSTANAQLERVARDFAAALLKSASVVAQARALLVALGSPAPTWKTRSKKRAVVPPTPVPAAAAPAVVVALAG